MRTAWACYLDSWESLAFRYGKKLVLLNVSVGAAQERGAADFGPLVYEAVVTETKGRSGTEGLFMNWTVATLAGAAADPSAVNCYPDTLSRISELWLSTAAPATATVPDTEPDEPDSEP